MIILLPPSPHIIVTSITNMISVMYSEIKEILRLRGEFGVIQKELCSRTPWLSSGRLCFEYFLQSGVYKRNYWALKISRSFCNMNQRLSQN